MNRILFYVAVVSVLLIPLIFPIPTIGAEDIYGLRIENITKDGADFHWSTSIETIGTIEYSYTKLSQLYNPQPTTPQTSVDILVSATPILTKTENIWVKSHHLRIDKLDLYYDPFIQYTIKSKTINGDVYSLNGEFVLVDSKKINWWQNWKFVIGWSIFMFILGLVVPRLITIRNGILKILASLHFKSNKNEE